MQRITVNKGDKLSSLEVSGDIKSNKQLQSDLKKDEQDSVQKNKIKVYKQINYEPKVIEKLLSNQAEFLLKDSLVDRI